MVERMIKLLHLNVTGITDLISARDTAIDSEKLNIIDDKITKMVKNITIFIIGFGAHCIISAILVIIFLVWFYFK